MLTINPSFIDLNITDDTEYRKVKEELTFTNKTAEQLYRRFRKNRWYLKANGEEAFYEELERLKSQVKQCLLFEDGTTYSGLANRLTKLTGKKLTNTIVYPEPKLVPWVNTPKNTMYYYQKEALEALLKAKHGGVEIATGLGKTTIILNLVKELGLPTIVMAPSTSIAEQLFESFTYHFGPKRVGKCYGSKRDFKKLITIALPQTLINLEPKSEEYKKLSLTKVFVADESHLCPANTLTEVCFGLVKQAPYRFFFSATQIRNDGKDLLLEAITGPIVYRMSLKEGVDQKFLSKPIFKMVKVNSNVQTYKTDPNDLTRAHLYYNPIVIQQAAFLANNFVKQFNHQVLILIDEIEQFTKLLPYLEHKAEFAHGPLGNNKTKVPEQYWDTKPNDLVERFNNNEFPILIGTSCISTGTDIRSVQTLIYLQGGKSEIQTTQAVGRATRKTPTKNSCNVIDFDVVNDEVCHRHALERTEIYNGLYPPVEELTLW